MKAFLIGMVIGFFGIAVYGQLYKEDHPKFKNQDCIAYGNRDQPEAWENYPKYASSRRIIEVGKNKYRTLYGFGANTETLAKNNVEADSFNEIDYIDRQYFKIDCETLEISKK